MGYITIPSAGTEGIFDMFSKKKKKKAKEKAKKAKKEEEELKKLEKEERISAALQESDPSKRPAGEGVGTRALFAGSPLQSIPSWAIYAGAGAAVLGIIFWSKK